MFESLPFLAPVSDYNHFLLFGLILLFVIAGTKLHFDELLHVGGLAIAFVLLRVAAKMLGCMLMAKRNGLTNKEAALSGLMLTPMAGLAIGLVQSTYNLYPEFSGQLTALILAAVAILETLGPIATEYALKQSGEVPADVSVKH